MPAQRHRPTGQQTPGAPSISATLASIDAKIKLIAQKLKILESNEQVISRTITSQARKIKDLETSVAAGGGKVDVSGLKDTLKQELKAEMIGSGGISPPLEESSPRTNAQITNIKRELEEIRRELKEVKYVIDSINPLEYVTLDQLDDVINRRLEKRND